MTSLGCVWTFLHIWFYGLNSFILCLQWWIPAPWPRLAPSSWPAVPAHKHLDNGFSETLSPAPPVARWWTSSGVSSSCCWTRCCRTCLPYRPDPFSPGPRSPETRAGRSIRPWTCRDPAAKRRPRFCGHRNWLIEGDALQTNHTQSVK